MDMPARSEHQENANFMVFGKVKLKSYLSNVKHNHDSTELLAFSIFETRAKNRPQTLAVPKSDFSIKFL